MSDDDLFYCSISQVNTAELCLRKWGHIKLDNDVRPGSKWQSLGVETHDQLATWSRRRQVPQFSHSEAEKQHAAELAQAIIPHLPPPQTAGLEIEGIPVGEQTEETQRTFKLRIDDIVWVGIVDLGIYSGRERPFVNDHKTTTDLKWALDEETMHDDAQVALYAVYGLIRMPEANACDVQWTYATTTTKKPKVKPVRRTLTLEEVAPRMERSMETAHLLKTIRRTPGLKAMDLPYDASACEAYGGCPYVSKCNLTPKERIQSIMSADANKKSFLDRLKARQGNAGAVNPPAAPAAPAPKPAEAAQPTEVPAPPSDPPVVENKEDKPVKPPKPPKPPKPAPAATSAAASEAAPAPSPDVRQYLEAWGKGFTDGFALGFREGRKT